MTSEPNGPLVESTYRGRRVLVELPDQRPYSAENGFESEQAVAEVLPLRIVDRTHYDAIDNDKNVPVEIKSCSIHVRDNGDCASGQFRLWRDQHTIVQLMGGYFVFVVHQRDPNNPEKLRFVENIIISADDLVDNYEFDWVESKHSNKIESPGRRGGKVQAIVKYHKIFGSLDRLPIDDYRPVEYVPGVYRPEDLE